MMRWERIGRALVGLAAILAGLISLFFLLSPQVVHTQLVVPAAGGTGFGGETTGFLTWYQVQGWWGVLVLVLFAGLYLAAYYLAWRQAYFGLAVLGIGLLGLSVVTALVYYRLAALVLLLGMGALALSRACQSAPDQPPA